MLSTYHSNLKDNIVLKINVANKGKKLKLSRVVKFRATENLLLFNI
jgi:hypothetical protein